MSDQIVASSNELTWVLDLYLFETLEQLREITHRWLIDYNEHRPHDALGDLPPVEYAARAKSSTYELSG